MKYKIEKLETCFKVEGEVWNDTAKQYCRCWTFTYSRYAAYKTLLKWFYLYIFKIDGALKN